MDDEKFARAFLKTGIFHTIEMCSNHCANWIFKKVPKIAAETCSKKENKNINMLIQH